MPFMMGSKFLREVILAWGRGLFRLFFVHVLRGFIKGCKLVYDVDVEFTVVSSRTSTSHY